MQRVLVMPINKGLSELRQGAMGNAEQGRSQGRLQPLIGKLQKSESLEGMPSFAKFRIPECHPTLISFGNVTHVVC